jgi:hypothetical protein
MERATTKTTFKGKGKQTAIKKRKENRKLA